ncbi:glutathione S-transferase family protein [Marinobacterium jannaschii]|uniref:glutathione S-transferase family protein n=1 Tax=Marinobacterium jannaschii TaxID=64970 RepID=UPI000486FABA|nr:glutathione S-transferase N-terminal domain-containing protein [Marinobacterium jannaschii]
MKLIGSSTSPYVRRLRLWLPESAYEFIDLNIFTPEGRDQLRQYTPAMKVPVLVDGEQRIYDSRVISRYLTQKMNLPVLSWEDENRLTLVDAAGDSFVTLLLLKRSGVAADAQPVCGLQNERIGQTLKVLEGMVADGGFADWNYPAICLYTMLDWVIFRELHDFSDLPNLSAFHKQHQQSENVARTDPRLAV